GRRARAADRLDRGRPAAPAARVPAGAVARVAPGHWSTGRSATKRPMPGRMGAGPWRRGAPPPSAGPAHAAIRRPDARRHPPARRTPPSAGPAHAGCATFRALAGWWRRRHRRPGSGREGDVMIRALSVAVPGKGLHEITGDVHEVVRGSGVREGLCTLFLRHTSASLVIQENADP